MKKIRKFFIAALFIFLLNNFISAENINFFTKSFFSNSQFWVRQDKNKFNPDDIETRKVFTNFFSGGVGVGLEFIIWDMGKARGSRLFFKTIANLVFSGINYAGFYNDDSSFISMQQLNINGGLFMPGIDWDFYLGGSFPKTDLLWGFGCDWTFLFPAYSPKYNVNSFEKTWYFYAAPGVLLGYDIAIPNTKFKITPQLKVGFTCNPIIPSEILIDGNERNLGYYTLNSMLSGPFFEFSLAFTFSSVKWKD